jgi:hypothetical protein
MNPATVWLTRLVKLQDQLIKLNVISNPASNLIVRNTYDLEVCGLTHCMLAGWLATYFFTQHGASIATGDDYRRFEVSP